MPHLTSSECHMGHKDRRGLTGAPGLSAPRPDPGYTSGFGLIDKSESLAAHPYLMQDYGKRTRNCYPRALKAMPLGQFHAPSFQRRPPLVAGQEDCGGFI